MPVSPTVPPQRTCVGCRDKGDKGELLRFVRSDGLLWDPEAVLPGRGAYLHPRQDCLDRAERSKAFTRALRLAKHEPLDSIRRMLAERYPSTPREHRMSTR